MNEELNDDVSVCSECDKHTNDNTETKWDKDADPYCVECFYNKELAKLTCYFVGEVINSLDKNKELARLTNNFVSSFNNLNKDTIEVKK